MPLKTSLQASLNTTLPTLMPYPVTQAEQQPSQTNIALLEQVLLQAQTILDLFDHHAMAQAQHVAYTFLPQGDLDDPNASESLLQSVSYGQLHQRAQAWAAQLQSQGCTRQPVLLMFPAGLEFIVAFLACLYAGAVAVPCVLARNSRHFQRVAHVLQDCGSTQVLTTPALQASLMQGFENLNLSPCVCVCVEPPTQAVIHFGASLRPSANDLAFLQYTSGSTGQPKGVAVTHGQLLANERAIKISGNAPWGLTVAGWLPQYHDMGLVGNVLLPLSLGGQLCFFSPLHFIQRPMRWLRLLSHTQAQISTAPNFGLALCNRLPWQDIAQESLDLSALQTLFCGAEPIVADTLLQFEARLKPFGLKPGTVQACYGMAESTLILTGGHSHRPRILDVSRSALAQGQAKPVQDSILQANSHHTQQLVNCGKAIDGHQVLAVNPDTLHPCPEGEIGELWAQGPSIAQGYWGSSSRSQQANQHTFLATLCDKTDGAHYLRTGDLGFVFQGCVYVTGRMKDLIIVRGCNYYPQDIEHTILQACPDFSEAAAFSVPSQEGQEGVAILIELPKSYWTNSAYNRAQQWQHAQTAVMVEHGLSLQGVHWLGPRAMPRTSSGKLQRHACQALYLQESCS